MIKFKKLRDDAGWGVIGPASEIKLGEVTVHKANGETQQKTVIRISKTFDVQGVSHVIGYLAPSPRRGSGAGSGCTCPCCKPRCLCDYTCNCRGGNIYDC